MSCPRFYFDVGSPYAWLAAERIEELLGPVEWAPVLLGGIFAATGRSSWARTDARSHGMAEVEKRALRYELRAVKWPASWPNDGLLAMRSAAAAGHVGRGRDFALAAMRLQFAEGRALSEPDNVRAAAEHCRIHPDALLARATSHAGKADLRSRTEDALAGGVFGVPTVIAAGRLLWGEDRLDEIPRRTPPNS